jgi:micrococcal nuclease
MKLFLLHMLLGLLAGAGLAIAFFAALIWADKSISAYGADFEMRYSYDLIKVLDGDYGADFEMRYSYDLIKVLDGDYGADFEMRYSCDLIKVLDGDTVKVNCPSWPEPFKETSLRVFGIDTPESIRGQAKCIKELKLGLNAKAWAKHEFEGAKFVAFTWAGTKDKYGGRIDANVTLPSGKSWAAEAVRIGMARPYGMNGKLKKSNWCK